MWGLHHGKDLDIAFFLASISLAFIGSPLHKRDNLITSMLFWVLSDGKKRGLKYIVYFAAEKVV